MKKAGKFEVAYEALARIASRPMTNEAVDELRRAINCPTSLLAARAAEIAGRRSLNDLIPDMIAAFERFLVGGARVDKQCNAKIAISGALNALEYLGDDVFLTGARYVQIEPAFGGPVDTAAQLRCNCVYGLARTGHPDVFYVLVDSLTDEELIVRVAASKALTYLGSPESELLLRLKVNTGDKDPEVIAGCFTGLMTMAPERSLDFVARYLGSGDRALAQCAAITLGESHLPKALEILLQRWEDDPSPSTHRMLILPIALLRSREAFDFLLGAVRASDRATAAEAVSALGIYTDDESVRKVQEAEMATRGRLSSS